MGETKDAWNQGACGKARASRTARAAAKDPSGVCLRNLEPDVGASESDMSAVGAMGPGRVQRLSQRGLEGLAPVDGLLVHRRRQVQL